MRENAIGVIELSACIGVEEEKLQKLLDEGATKAISDALARTLEQTFSKPQGWMDQGVESSALNYDLFGG